MVHSSKPKQLPHHGVPSNVGTDLAVQHEDRDRESVTVSQPSLAETSSDAADAFIANERQADSDTRASSDERLDEVSAEAQSGHRPTSMAEIQISQSIIEGSSDTSVGKSKGLVQEKPGKTESPGYRIFIIDSGWNSVARKVLNENLQLFHEMTEDDPTYMLDRDRSARILRRHRHLIGRDPIICVHDMANAWHDDGSKIRGCRAHLGLLRDEKTVLHTLQMFARLLSSYRDSRNLEKVVRRRLRREGVAGAIEIIVNRGGEAQT